MPLGKSRRSRPAISGAKQRRSPDGRSGKGHPGAPDGQVHLEHRSRHAWHSSRICSKAAISVTGVVVAVGATVLVPVVAPAVASLLRPAAKAAIKGGILAY